MVHEALQIFMLNTPAYVMLNNAENVMKVPDAVNLSIPRSILTWIPLTPIDSTMRTMQPLILYLLNFLVVDILSFDLFPKTLFAVVQLYIC